MDRDTIKTGGDRVQYRSVFDIIGPVMLGPSSSHTAGAARIGKVARMIFGSEPESVTVYFYGSFAQTYRGHATDVAVIGGLLDFSPDDAAMVNALPVARERGISLRFVPATETPVHPNTIRLVLQGTGQTMDITGVSVGGGMIRIVALNQFQLQLSGEQPTLLILHQDRRGVIAAVAGCLSRQGVNISHMEVSRLKKGQRALMVIETDQAIEDDTFQDIMGQQHVVKAARLKE